MSHHTEWPGYYEEVKIELPPNLNDRHHLFFTFFHVVVSSKKKEREKKTPIGFAFLPVLTDKGQHAAGDFDLPVASAEHRYDTGGTNYILPPNYTRARAFGRRHHWQQQKQQPGQRWWCWWRERPWWRWRCRWCRCRWWGWG